MKATDNPQGNWLKVVPGVGAFRINLEADGKIVEWHAHEEIENSWTGEWTTDFRRDDDYDHVWKVVHLMIGGYKTDLVANSRDYPNQLSGFELTPKEGVSNQVRMFRLK